MNIEKSLEFAPFNLSESDIAWVKKTRDGLSTEAKLRQLFVHIMVGDNPADAQRLGKLAAGGVHRFMGPDLDVAWQNTRTLLEMSEVPLFITGDIEGGGHGAPSMLHFPNQLGLAAANDLELSARLLNAVCAESKAFGFNWSFTPVVDVNKQTASSIVGTRSYGSEIEKIIAQARVHIKTLQANGIAATAKHWPGEGYDSRDQHLVTTINPLTMDEWNDVFGRIYKNMIGDGVMTVMSAHIALPHYMAQHGIPKSIERYRPASVSKLLNQDLLRGELGFNGLVVSDATSMGGLTSWDDRAVSVPAVIENGCDVFLFCTDIDRDFEHMQNGLRSGKLSEQRLEDAVTRILAMKAALGLHKKSLDERLPPLDRARATVKSADHLALAKAVADKSITLVKDVNHTLPLNVAKHKRITLIEQGGPPMFPGAPRKMMTVLTEHLKTSGFEIKPFDAAQPPSPENTDLLLYIFATESSFLLSRIYIDWMAQHPNFVEAMQRYWHDLPTVMISFGHPYYLGDAPRVPTYVNAYSTIASVQLAVAEKLLGNAPFEGVSPVDPFAGAPDAEY